MSGSDTGDVDLGTIQNDLAALRADVELLLAHLKSGARDSAAGAASQIGESASGLSQCVAHGGDKTTRAIDSWVAQRPLLAILIAAGVGFVGARVWRG